jgi:hypothetical protein
VGVCAGVVGFVLVGAGSGFVGVADRTTSAFPSPGGSVLVAERRLTTVSKPQTEPAATTSAAAMINAVRAPLAVAERWLYT